MAEVSTSYTEYSSTEVEPMNDFVEAKDGERFWLIILNTFIHVDFSNRNYELYDKNKRWGTVTNPDIQYFSILQTVVVARTWKGLLEVERGPCFIY